jgi:hypothetical protein
MCMGALPLLAKATGGNVGDMALTTLSPAASIMSMLSKKKKPAVPQGVTG